MTDGAPPVVHPLTSERYRLLGRIAAATEVPMMVLGFLWLFLLIVDEWRGLPPIFLVLSECIWVAFIIHFFIEFAIAPHKGQYLRRHWLTAIALIFPAFRLFRVTRVLRIAGEWEMVGVVGGVNSAIDTLGRLTGRRGIIYAVLLTIVVIVLGAAGMWALEHQVPGSGVSDFGSAMWWTAMAMLTIGTDWMPKTPQGRMLCLVLAAYGLSVFGYLTAAIASVFVAKDVEEDDGVIRQKLESMESEMILLRRDMQSLILALGETRANTPG